MVQRNRWFIFFFQLTARVSFFSALLVQTQHPIEDLQPDNVQASQHVLPRPLDLALPLPPLKRLPARALSLPIALLSLPSLAATQAHTVLHIAGFLRTRLARLLSSMYGLRSAYARRMLFFKCNERNGDFVRGWMQVTRDRGV